MSSNTRISQGPNYDVVVDAGELLADLATDAADYGTKHEEKRRLWRDSWDWVDGFPEAQYWMLEAFGGLRAYSKALGQIQAGGQFRNDDGTVDVRGYMKWLSHESSVAHEDSYGPYTETRQASEMETAYARILSTLREDYGVGWPRLDDISGTPLESDLP